MHLRKAFYLFKTYRYLPQKCSDGDSFTPRIYLLDGFIRFFRFFSDSLLGLDENQARAPRIIIQITSMTKNFKWHSRYWEKFQSFCSITRKNLRSLGCIFVSKKPFKHKRIILTRKHHFDTKVSFWHQNAILTQKCNFETKMKFWHKNTIFT